MDDADPNEVKLSPAWQKEIAARMESIRQGTAKLIPHDEVMVGIRSKLVMKSVHCSRLHVLAGSSI